MSHSRKEYTRKHYWNDLDNLLKAYDMKFSDVKPKNNSDLQSYQCARERLEAILKLGIEIDKTLLVHVKIELGRKLDKLSEEQFQLGDMQDIPGPKSFTFSQHVLLPALKKSLDIHHGKITTFFSKQVGISIEDRMQKAAPLLEVLERKINEYTASTSPHIKQSIFNTNNNQLPQEPPLQSKKEDVKQVVSPKI